MPAAAAAHLSEVLPAVVRHDPGLPGLVAARPVHAELPPRREPRPEPRPQPRPRLAAPGRVVLVAVGEVAVVVRAAGGGHAEVLPVLHTWAEVSLSVRQNSIVNESDFILKKF